MCRKFLLPGNSPVRSSVWQSRKRPCAPVQGPPGRRGKPQKLGVSDTPSFWRISAAPAGLEPAPPGKATHFRSPERGCESSQMRAGGVTEAIWDDSARRSCGSARGNRRGRIPLMYSTAAPGGQQRVPSLACAEPHFLRFLEKPGSRQKPRFCRHGGVTMMDINY